MMKINKHLLPIKAHFFCFMGAMGPILPQLSVLGKQVGIPPEVMGYITSVLPIMYVIAKPLFGYIVDYFSAARKLIFMVLIVVMTLSFGAFHFLPDSNETNSMLTMDSWHALINTSDLKQCTLPLASDLRSAVCKWNTSNIDVYVQNSSSLEAVQLSNNSITKLMNDQLTYTTICLQSKSAVDDGVFDAECTFTEATAEVMNNLYGSAMFWTFVILMCLGTIGFNVTNSISDAICFDMLGKEEESKYGAQRVWGTIGFGLTALLAGIAVDLWTVDTVKSMAPALTIMLIFSGLDLMSVSKLKLPKLSTSESIFTEVWQLITQPAIGIFLLFATIAGIIDSFIIYFMFWHLEEVAASTGYMHQIKLIEGCVVAAECLAGEVPFFFYSGKIIKKLGYVNCMSMCFFFYALRLALISWIPNPWYLVGVELFFQGCTYALCYTCIVAYAAVIAPPGTTATVQGLIAGMDDGLGFSIGSLIGGLAFKQFGGQKSFMYFAIAASITCVLHIVIRAFFFKKQSHAESVYHAPKEQNVCISLPSE